MKRIIKIIIILFLIMGFKYVKAETFVEGKYISGEYISKKKDGKIHYLTVQFLKDNNGNIVYCLEPYTKFEEGKSYTSYEGDISGYADLNADQKRLISLIVYYGYGYNNRSSNKWYAITQYLIWDTVTGNNGSVYFTDKLNGKKITKYADEINELKEDVNNHDIKPEFIHDYEVDLKSDLYIDSGDYEVMSSDYDYEYTKGILFKEIKNNGRVQISKLSNYYDRKVAIFDSTSSQDLIRPGNVNNTIYDININVKKGNIILDIKKDDSVYTVESDFSNTCYDIYSNDVVIDSVCTDDEMVYSTIDLNYGDYVIKQRSRGIGYRNDDSVYRVTIDSSNNKPIVYLYNYLIRNEIKIKKYQCIKDNCIPEQDAKFNVFDKNNKLVNSLITDEEGYTKILLGYGTYNIKQVSGLLDYTLVDDFSERIIDEEGEHYKELNNYLIEKEVVVKRKVEEPEEEEIEVEEVPNTETDGSWLTRIIFWFAELVISIFNKIVN